MRGFKRNADNSWTVTVADLKNNEAEHDIKAKFVFIGAGGAALKLLQETDIPEAKGYARFPGGRAVPGCGQSGRSQPPPAKVYGQASVGARADVRTTHRHAYPDGKRVVLFGPFATFSAPSS